MIMRNFILFIAVVAFVGCDPNTDTEILQGTDHDWWFEIRVDGVPHRIEGRFNSCDLYNWDSRTGSNIGNCNSSMIEVSLGDKSESNYVEGEFFTISMATQNLTLGLNDYSLIDEYSTYNSLIGILSYQVHNKGSVNGLNPYANFSLFPIDTMSSCVSSKFPLNITQYPTPHTSTNNTCWDIGDPMIGSGSATIYVLDTIIEQTVPYTYRYNRPYHIEIDFKLYQFPY